MNYLNFACLDGASAKSFQAQNPYPWAHMRGTLTDEGWNALRDTIPDISKFNLNVGVKRAHGQAPHDRGILHYSEGMDCAQPWKEFIAELHGKAYDSFLRRMLGLTPDQKIILTMEWYYAWQGCSVSPHCDARRKLATHIFFFADDEDWPREWGGDILILDDERRYKAHSAPGFKDLKVAASLDLRKNGSLLFQRTEHSWHGVEPLRSPDPGVYRKLFIVTVNIPTFQVWWRRVRGKDPDGHRLHA
jgi:2OG-Fe(II) oxygenase superfamily